MQVTASSEISLKPGRVPYTTSRGYLTSYTFQHHRKGEKFQHEAGGPEYRLLHSDIT